MRCYNCGKNAMFMIGPKGQEAPLCLDCYVRWSNVQLQQQEMFEREINYLAAEMESIVGIPGIAPRYPERRTLIQTGGTTLNNIHVSNSEIGILNTGTIENVDSTVTVLKTEGNRPLAEAVTKLSEAIIKTKEMSATQKDQSLELLASISEEAVAPTGKRKLAVVQALLTELSGVLGGVTSLAKSWEAASAVFRAVFGI